jgi:hypothetical protein
MQTPQPASEWFGIEQRAKERSRSSEQKRREHQRQKEQKAEYVPGETITEDEEWFRHHNWQGKRQKVRQALVDAGTSQSAVFNFDQCGAECTVEWNATEKRYRCRGCYCHSRHCEPCMRAKSSLITTNLRKIMGKDTKPVHRFITLTLRNTDAPLKQEIKRLYAAYKQLRARPEWKSSQKGGAATLEVKYNNATKKWHPHLHIISEGDYLSTYWLSQTWRDITGDSHVVDVRKISADKDVAYYVGKYVTKGTNAEVWETPEVAAEWVKAIKGVRMCATFGTWRGYKLLERPKDEPGAWKPIATLGSIVRQAQAGSQWALDLLVHLTTNLSYNPSRPRHHKRE